MNKELKVGLWIVIPILAICAVFPLLRGFFFFSLAIILFGLFCWGCVLLIDSVPKFISKIMNKDEDKDVPHENEEQK